MAASKKPTGTERSHNNEKARNAPPTTRQADRQAVAPTQDAESRPNAPAQGGRMMGVQPSGYDGQNPATAGPGGAQDEVNTSVNVSGDNPTGERPGKEGGGDLRGRRATDHGKGAA